MIVVESKQAITRVPNNGILSQVKTSTYFSNTPTLSAQSNPFRLNIQKTPSALSKPPQQPHVPPSSAASSAIRSTRGAGLPPKSSGAAASTKGQLSSRAIQSKPPPPIPPYKANVVHKNVKPLHGTLLLSDTNLTFSASVSTSSLTSLNIMNSTKIDIEQDNNRSEATRVDGQTAQIETLISQMNNASIIMPQSAVSTALAEEITESAAPPTPRTHSLEVDTKVDTPKSSKAVVSKAQSGNISRKSGAELKQMLTSAQNESENQIAKDPEDAKGIKYYRDLVSCLIMFFFSISNENLRQRLFLEERLLT